MSKSKVINLYKEFLHLAKVSHEDYLQLREKIKAEFMANRNLEENQVKIALVRGNYKKKELEDFIQLHKYRSMKKRYESLDDKRG